MTIVRAAGIAALVLVLTSACAVRSGDIAAQTVDRHQFAGWDCPRLHRELDEVQRAGTRMAYAMDERAGNNIIAMGLGMTVFWPALLTMRPAQPAAHELAALKGRFEALREVAQQRGCSDTYSAAELQQLSVRPGDRLSYEQRMVPRSAPRSWTLTVQTVTRQELVLDGATIDPGRAAAWQFDRSGNLLRAPVGPVWPQLLRGELSLGALVSGELTDPTDPMVRARVRGQVVAVGPQVIGERTLDAAVIDLFGDAQNDSFSGRLDGVLVVDRVSGLLLRLDLSSPHASFRLQRRLVRIQAGP